MNLALKICGITNEEDAQVVASINPDFIGFVLYEKSSRYIDEVLAKNLYDQIKEISPQTKVVGVSVNASLEDLEKYDFLDGFQFHGDENPSYIFRFRKKNPNHYLIKAYRVRSQTGFLELSSHVDAYLVDAFCEEYGGSGKRIAKESLERIFPLFSEYPFFIAGGVNAQNIKEISQYPCLYGVDLSSSLELSPGKKDSEKIKDFFSVFKAL